MSKRIQRVNQLIKKELSKILLKEVDFPKNILLSITRVDASVDLRIARVYISYLPEKETKKAFKILNQLIYNFQQKLNKRLNMRPIPRIKFIQDKEIKKTARIEELLEEIKKRG
jgi:ribosome-binding factor A